MENTNVVAKKRVTKFI